MADEHLSLRLLKELVVGDDRLPEPQLRQMLRHILETCSECSARYESVIAEWRTESAGKYGGLATELLGRLSKQGLHSKRLHSEAEEDCASLLKIEADERRLRIQRALSRFRSPHLVDRLLQQSQRNVVKDPYRALDLAECSHEVALRIPQDLFGPGWAMTSVARANAHRGNAHRVLGDFQAAERLLSMAYSLFLREGDGDPLIEAEILKIHARVYMDLRRFRKAEGLFDLALSFFRACGEEARVAETLIAMAILYSESDRTREAVTTIKTALTYIHPQSQERMYLYAQHNLAHYLRDSGEFIEARELMAANAELYARFPEPLLQLRRRWLSATVARELGDLENAQTELTEIREGFRHEGLVYDAALAGLDLSLVHVALGNRQELQTLARELVPVFSARDIPREATAAWMLFQEAARQEAVTETIVHKLARSVKLIQQQPRRNAS